MTWRPIETAPKDGTEVMLTDSEEIYLGQWTGTVWAGPEGGLGAFTHWMPLPDPPGAESKRSTCEGACAEKPSDAPPFGIFRGRWALLVPGEDPLIVTECPWCSRPLTDPSNYWEIRQIPPGVVAELWRDPMPPRADRCNGSCPAAPAQSFVFVAMGRTREGKRRTVAASIDALLQALSVTRCPWCGREFTNIPPPITIDMPSSVIPSRPSLALLDGGREPNTALQEVNRAQERCVLERHFEDVERRLIEGDPTTAGPPPAVDNPEPCAHCADHRWCLVTGCTGVPKGPGNPDPEAPNTHQWDES